MMNQQHQDSTTKHTIEILINQRMSFSNHLPYDRFIYFKMMRWTWWDEAHGRFDEPLGRTLGKE